MKADFFYRHAPGRMMMKAIEKTGAFKAASCVLNSRISRILIPSYIRRNKVNMRCFKGQKYDSFAAFFARKKRERCFPPKAPFLISPCDGMLSIYHVSDELVIPMKESWYLLSDLIPDKETAGLFRNGLCFVFRLRDSDYHHFCAFDDLKIIETHHIPGKLHSVQPIAHEYYHVFRLNRRWWSVLETEHFGRVLQIEVGAMLVGDVSFSEDKGTLLRGEDMGNFELAGSTVILFLDSSVKERLELFPRYIPAMRGDEKPVFMGCGLGIMNENS